MTRQFRLKKDLIIPAGSILKSAPIRTERAPDMHFEYIVGLTDNTHGSFIYCINEIEELSDWFEEEK